MCRNTDEKARSAARERQRRYRAAHPGRKQIQRMRDAASLLQRNGFEISGGNLDLNNLYALDDETSKEGRE